jgi:effector-binding domain-containing protein
MREYGSEHYAISLPDRYFDNLSELERNITYLRSGREALMLASIAASTKKEKVVLFPAYCCWSMSAPFKKTGWSIVYYRLNEDLSVDTNHLMQLLTNNNVDAVLTMNYFGVACTDETVNMVKRYNADVVVIEDFSHCTFGLKQIFNPQIDIYVSSIRKSIGICDGAIILSKREMPMQYVNKEESEFYEKRYNALKEKSLYSYTKGDYAKIKFLQELRECENTLNEFTTIHAISEQGLQMIRQVNGEEVKFARKENMKHLLCLLEGKIHTVPGIEKSINNVPFSLPILVSHREQVQKMLANNGIYAPVLWPICDEAEKVCLVSSNMANHMLSIPVDQRYDWDDIEEIANRLLKVLGSSANIS